MRQNKIVIICVLCLLSQTLASVAGPMTTSLMPFPLLFSPRRSAIKAFVGE